MYTQTELNNIRTNILKPYKRVKKDKLKDLFHKSLIVNQSRPIGIEYSEITNTVFTRSQYDCKLIHAGRRIGCTTIITIEALYQAISSSQKILIVVNTISEKNGIMDLLRSIGNNLYTSQTNYTNNTSTLFRNTGSKIDIVGKEEIIKNPYFFRGREYQTVLIDGADRINSLKVFEEVKLMIMYSQANVIMTTSSTKGFEHVHMFLGRPYSYFALPTYCLDTFNTEVEKSIRQSTNDYVFKEEFTLGLDLDLFKNDSN